MKSRSWIVLVAIVAFAAACSDERGETLPSSIVTTTTTTTTVAPAEDAAPTTVTTAAPEPDPDRDPSLPRALTDHFHSAYTLWVCDEEVRGFPEDVQDNVTGIHTHGDGLIHIHPFIEEASGTAATLGLFFEESGGLLEDDRVVMPTGVYEEGADTCDGEPGQVMVFKWNDVEALAPDVYTSGLADIGLDQQSPDEGQLFVIAFVPEGTDAGDIQRPDDTFLRENYLGLPPADTGSRT